jgi:hypothetical protein
MVEIKRSLISKPPLQRHRRPRFHVDDSVEVQWDGHPNCRCTIKTSREIEFDGSKEYQLLKENGEDYEEGAWVEEKYLLNDESI